jgi:transcriptional regulator with XRE-family HTH domain
MNRGYDEGRWVQPDGLAIQRLRRDRGWSRRDLLEAIGEAALRATGIRETISQNLLEAIEEGNEAIPYSTPQKCRGPRPSRSSWLEAS